MELGDRWVDGIPLDEAAKWLGLSERIVLELVRADLLFAECGPEIDGSRCWVFSKQAVTECCYEVTKHLRRYVPGCAMIDLGQATQMLLRLGYDEAHILKHVARGNLVGYLPTGSRGLERMMFCEGDVRAFLEGSKAEKGWMSDKEVGQQMGVKGSTVARWTESGLLSPVVVCDSACYFDQDTSKQFITEHVFIEEAAQIAGVEVDMVRKWMREGLLRPVSGPKVDFYYRELFRREEIEQLCSRNQLARLAESDLPSDS